MASSPFRLFGFSPRASNDAVLSASRPVTHKVLNFGVFVLLFIVCEQERCISPSNQLYCVATEIIVNE